MTFIRKALLGLSIFAILSSVSFAQGDGPRSFMLVPKGIWGVNARWLGMDQNINATGTILVPASSIKVDVFPITLYHTFSLGGRFAQFSVMVNPGSVSASAEKVPPIIPLPTNTIKASGLSDGFLDLRVGLAGAPAVDVISYMKKPMAFSQFGQARYWYSGSYDASKVLSLGTNRSTYQLGLPMSVPLNKNLEKATWLEVAPSIMLFGANNEPARGTFAKKIEQAPIFSLETHISHNFNPKLWVFGNLLYHVGGQTSTDGEKNDNQQNMLGGGLGAGYQFLPFFGAYADYGTILLGGPNNARSNMIRVAINFTYVNVKKLKASAAAQGK
jgi:hypothetical protein